MSNRDKCVEYDGHIISQCGSNHHIMISKDGQMLFHTQSSCDKTETQLIDFYNNNYKRIREITQRLFESDFEDEDTEE